MTPEEKDAELRTEMVRRGLWRSCLNCEYWGPPAENEQSPSHCMKFGQTPPAEVIVVGCPHYLREIPF